MKRKVERMKMLPATKMRSMDLQKHLQEFREKLRKQKMIDEALHDVEYHHKETLMNCVTRRRGQYSLG